MYKIYISSSMQENNKGVNNYGNEEHNMFLLADKVKDLLEENGHFKVFRNRKEWSLHRLVQDVNFNKPHLFIDNHSNSGSPDAEGSETFYYGDGGTDSNSYRIASLLYNEIKNVYNNKDRGIKRDDSLYETGLYVIRNTVCPSCLAEHFFHSNIKSVEHWKHNIDKYAYAEYVAICKYFNIEYEEDKNIEEYYKKKFEDLRDFINETLEYGGN